MASYQARRLRLCWGARVSRSSMAEPLPPEVGGGHGRGRPRGVYTRRIVLLSRVSVRTLLHVARRSRRARRRGGVLDVKAGKRVLGNPVSCDLGRPRAAKHTLFRFFWFAYARVLSFLMPRNKRTRSPTLSMPISLRTSLSISSRFSPLMWFLRKIFSYSPHLTVRR